MAKESAIFRRSELLLGSEAMERIAEKRVIIFGVGGVGSWCAESLVRSGIRQLTIVDSDRVCITNINRQLMATQLPASKLFSSMGAALKLDPTRIKVTEFWKVQGDPLARAIRKKFKHYGRFPEQKFQVVYSDELLDNRGCPMDEGEEPSQFTKPQTNGTLAHITAIFGFMLAGLVIQDICK